MDGHFKLAEQIGQIGFFGEISLTAFPEHENIVKIGISEAQQEWEPGIRFGVNYFLRNCKSINGIRVIVTSLNTNPVDTSQMVVAYIVTKALNSLFDQMNVEPFFDKNTQLFCFPK